MTQYNEIKVTGNLGADPEVNQVGQDAVANFSLAHTPRVRDDQGNWGDGETVWYDCAAWGNVGRKVADNLSKGMQVTVSGRPKLEEFQRRDGSQGAKISITVKDVKQELFPARDGQGGQAQGGWNNAGGGFNAQNGGSGGFRGPNQAGGHSGGQTPQNGNQGGFGQPQQNPGGPQGDPWNSAPPAGGYNGQGQDEPPF